jgi:uncharacterized membrane protein (UPF0127 family)
MSFTSFFHLIFQSCSFFEYTVSESTVIHNFSQCTIDFFDQKITLDLAISKNEQELGLSYRKHIGIDEGMLFPIKKKKSVSFHSHTISFDICIVFIDEFFQILDSQILRPNEEIMSPRNTFYVLEMSPQNCSKMKTIKSLSLCDGDW